MLSNFNNCPIRVGTGSATINPLVSPSATAAAETINEFNWIIQVDC